MDPANLPEVDILAPGGGRYTLREFGRQAVKLGKGGAGIVYSHPRLPGQAIKIYHDQRRAEAHRDKVRAMLRTPPRAVRTARQIVQLAWPEGEVVLKDRFIGFTMPRIDFRQAWKLQ
jgi:DNA-binding helix-hairpin-helix protein with protein kinase domain